MHHEEGRPTRRKQPRPCPPCISDLSVAHEGIGRRRGPDMQRTQTMAQSVVVSMTRQTKRFVLLRGVPCGITGRTYSDGTFLVEPFPVDFWRVRYLLRYVYKHVSTSRCQQIDPLSVNIEASMKKLSYNVDWWLASSSTLPSTILSKEYSQLSPLKLDCGSVSERVATDRKPVEKGGPGGARMK